MKRLYFEQRFYIFLIVAAIFGLVGDRAWEWQKGVLLEDIFTPDSFELMTTNQGRTIASDPRSDPSPDIPAPPSSSWTESVVPTAPDESPSSSTSPVTATTSAPTTSAATTSTKALPVDSVVLSEATEKLHRWHLALASKNKKQRPSHAEIVAEINKLLIMVSTTVQPLNKSEAYRLMAGMEFALAREVLIKKVILRKRGFGHLQESIKAFPGNFLSQWQMGLVVLKISHLSTGVRPVVEQILDIHVDDELKNSTLGVMPFTDNVYAQFLLETLLQVRDSKKQLSKEDAQVYAVVKQNVKNFRSQPSKAQDVKNADSALEKFRVK